MEYTKEELENEIWLDVLGYENLYTVSSLGRVIRNGFTYYSPYAGNVVESEKLINGSNKEGYRQVRLFKDGIGKFFMIHQLVMIAFKDNPENKPFVNHLNSKRDDNRLLNLEWCTPKENIIHAHLSNKMKRRFYMPNGEDSKNSKITQDIANFIRENKGVLTQNEMAFKFSISQSAINKVLSGKTWNIKE